MPCSGWGAGQAYDFVAMPLQPIGLRPEQTQCPLFAAAMIGIRRRRSFDCNPKQRRAGPAWVKLTIGSVGRNFCVWQRPHSSLLASVRDRSITSYIAEHHRTRDYKDLLRILKELEIHTGIVLSATVAAHNDVLSAGSAAEMRSTSDVQDVYLGA